MVSAALLLFIIVLSVSYIVFWSSKHLIYKLNKRVLARNLAVIKNGKYLENFENLSEDEIRENIILRFSVFWDITPMIEGSFRFFKKRAPFLPDYITKKVG